MSDTPTPDPSPVATPVETPPAASSSPVSPPADDPIGELPEDQAVFDRGYVSKVRSEALRYREEARTASEALSEYQDTFGVYEDTDRQVWLDLARTWVDDPNQAASVMRQIADAVLGGDEPEPDEPDTPDDTETEGELTREQIEEMIRGEFNSYEQEQAMARAVDTVNTELRDLGYDPATREGFMVLWTANNETNGDLPAAVALIKADQQKTIDEYVAGRSNGNRAALTPQGGVVASADQPIKNLDDARKATEAFLKSQQRTAG